MATFLRIFLYFRTTRSACRILLSRSSLYGTRQITEDSMRKFNLDSASEVYQTPPNSPTLHAKIFGNDGQVECERMTLTPRVSIVYGEYRRLSGFGGIEIRGWKRRERGKRRPCYYSTSAFLKSIEMKLASWHLHRLRPTLRLFYVRSKRP